MFHVNERFIFKLNIHQDPKGFNKKVLNYILSKRTVGVRAQSVHTSITLYGLYSFSKRSFAFVQQQEKQSFIHGCVRDK